MKLINQMNKTIKYKDFSHLFFPALQFSRGSAEHWKGGCDGWLVLTKIENQLFTEVRPAGTGGHFHLENILKINCKSFPSHQNLFNIDSYNEWVPQSGPVQKFLVLSPRIIVYKYFYK